MIEPRLVVGCNYHATWQTDKAMRFVLTKLRGSRARLETRRTKKKFWTDTGDLIFITSNCNIKKAQKIQRQENMVDFTKMRIDKILGPKGSAQKHPQLLPLLEDISGGRLPENKDKIDSTDCSGELPVRPIHKRVMPCEVDKALLKCADKTGKHSPAEMGVYYDVEAKCKVATNRNVLVVVPAPELDWLSLKVTVSKEDSYKDFPNYKSVLPPTPSSKVIRDLDPKELLAKVRGAVRASAFCKGREVLMVLKDDEGIISFYPKIMELALVALISTGTTSVTLEAGEGLRCPTMLRDSKDPDKLALIMPTLPYAGGHSRRHEETELIYTHLTPYSFE